MEKPVERALLINDYKFREVEVIQSQLRQFVSVCVSVCAELLRVLRMLAINLYTHTFFLSHSTKKGSIWQPPLLCVAEAAATFHQLCQVFKYEILPELQASA